MPPVNPGSLTYAAASAIKGGLGAAAGENKSGGARNENASQTKTVFPPPAGRTYNTSRGTDPSFPMPFKGLAECQIVELNNGSAQHPL